MSHSKHRKRGYSLYIENWNRSAKKYINICCICGHKGYSPVIEQDVFCITLENKAVYSEAALSAVPEQYPALREEYRRYTILPEEYASKLLKL